MERLLTLYSEVQSTDVRWLWYPFIAIGKITLLQGDPGDGKSSMCNLSQGVKAEGISIGEMRMLVKQVRKGRVTIEEAAEDAGMTVEEFKKILENALPLIDFHSLSIAH